MKYGVSALSLYLLLTEYYLNYRNKHIRSEQPFYGVIIICTVLLPPMGK